MPEPIAYLNGQTLPVSRAAVPLNDASFVMGATVTDLCRTVNHKLYRWDDHLARFQQSCRAAQIDPPMTEHAITLQAHELADHNARLLRPEEDLALVLFVTPGLIGYYAGFDGGAGDALPAIGMHTFPLPFSRYRSLFREGAHLVVPRTLQVPAACVDPRIKQRSRLHWWLADREVHAACPGAMAVLLDHREHLTETAAANLLIVKDGAVHSPPPETILGGISLLTVAELCLELRIPLVRRPLTVEDANTADEILLASTSWCLCGVSKFNNRITPWPGPVFQRLLATWSHRIGLDIRGQIER